MNSDVYVYALWIILIVLVIICAITDKEEVSKDKNKKGGRLDEEE